MTVAGIRAVVATELMKVSAQWRARAAVMICAVGPFAFATAMRVQSSVPADTLFGRAVADSGFAVPLVVLGFGALWPFPALAAFVAGDIFAAEDRYGTWATLLTRSRSRADIFAGKTVVAMTFSAVAVAVLASSSIAAGLLVVGSQPLIGLSGLLLEPGDAVTSVSLAWATVLAPTFAFTAIAVLVSVALRSSAAGIGLPVVVALVMQLTALVDGPEAARRLVISTAFGAWHGLFTQPRYYMPLVYGGLVSLFHVAACLALAYWLLTRRDIGR